MTRKEPHIAIVGKNHHSEFEQAKWKEALQEMSLCWSVVK